MLDERNVTEEIASEDEDDNPGNPAYDIISDETPVRHTPNAGYEGCESTYDGNKSSNNNCFSTVFFVELVSAMKVFFIEET